MQVAQPTTADRSTAGIWPAGVTPTREYEAAVAHVRESSSSLFITGRAGTGKSTLLKCLARAIGERSAIVAPTGLAAVNVGGQTIHSFFGFPPRLLRPDDIKRSRNGRLMRKLDVLIIDEISMVRSDLMWRSITRCASTEAGRANRSVDCAC